MGGLMQRWHRVVFALILFATILFIFSRIGKIEGAYSIIETLAISAIASLSIVNYITVYKKTSDTISELHTISKSASAEDGSKRGADGLLAQMAVSQQLAVVFLFAFLHAVLLILLMILHKDHLISVTLLFVIYGMYCLSNRCQESFYGAICNDPQVLKKLGERRDYVWEHFEARIARDEENYVTYVAYSALAVVLVFLQSQLGDGFSVGAFAVGAASFHMVVSAWRYFNLISDTNVAQKFIHRASSESGRRTAFDQLRVVPATWRVFATMLVPALFVGGAWVPGVWALATTTVGNGPNGG